MHDVHHVVATYDLSGRPLGEVALLNVPVLGGWATRRMFADDFRLPEDTSSSAPARNTGV